MPSDLSLKVVSRVHRGILAASRGWFGWTLYGMPVIQLTTTGRRSGEPRTTMLALPYQEGSTLVVVASRGGDDRTPAWFLNLRDNPDVSVVMKGKSAKPMRAEVASSEERARLWLLVTTDHGNYASYQSKTDREIPLVLLRPRDDSGS